MLLVFVVGILVGDAVIGDAVVGAVVTGGIVGEPVVAGNSVLRGRGLVSSLQTHCK